VGGVHEKRLTGLPVADGDVPEDFLISLDGQRVVYRADQDTDGVNGLTDEVFELFSVILQAKPKALFESPVALVRSWAFDTVTGVIRGRAPAALGSGCREGWDVCMPEEKRFCPNLTTQLPAPQRCGKWI
jgi:hypothetical protein